MNGDLKKVEAKVHEAASTVRARAKSLRENAAASNASRKARVEADKAAIRQAAEEAAKGADEGKAKFII